MKFNHDTQNCDFWRSYVFFWKLVSSWEGSHFILVRDFFLECNYYRSDLLSKTKNTFHLPSWELTNISLPKNTFESMIFRTSQRWDPMESFPGENWLQGSRVIPGTPKDMGPPKMVSWTHTIPISLGIVMGIVWVPLTIFEGPMSLGGPWKSHWRDLHNGRCDNFYNLRVRGMTCNPKKSRNHMGVVSKNRDGPWSLPPQIIHLFIGFSMK